MKKGLPAHIKHIKKADLMFLIAMADRGIIAMAYYNEPGAAKARARLNRVKQETSKVAGLRPASENSQGRVVRWIDEVDRREEGSWEEVSARMKHEG